MALEKTHYKIITICILHGAVRRGRLHSRCCR